MSNMTNRYLKAIWLYLQTEKGRHDCLDYTKAVFIIILVIVIVMVSVNFFLCK